MGFEKAAMLNHIRVKLMLMFSLFALVPLCALGAFSLRTAEELVLNMVTNQVEQVARDKGALLERWISERKADIAVVAGSIILASGGPEEIEAYLRLVRENYRVYSGISVVSRDGKVIYTTSREAFIPEETAWVREAAEGNLHMSDIAFNPERNESFFRVSAPLTGGTPEVERIVSATVGTNTILSAILSVSLGETGECYLVDRDGMFLAHKEPRRILTESIAQSESFKNIFNRAGNRITYVDYRGIEVIGASARVEGTEWALVVEQDRDEAFRSADSLRRTIFVVIGLSIFGALIFAWLLSRYVADPIRKLSEAAKQVAVGEYDRIDVKTHRNDEIGLLYRAFADMAEQLRHRQHSLEEQVFLREAELKETGVELRKTQQAAARSQQLASLGQLAAGVAHEIRTPLTSLKLFLESVAAEIEISGEFEEDFQVAMKQIRRMEATINRFLDFARPQEPIMTHIHPVELIEEALLVVGPKARQQETVIRMELPSSLPCVRGDRKQLGEVLVNLMVNALEAMAARGAITIGAKEERMTGGGGAGQYIRMDIEDTGPGISEESVPKLFDPFFTSKATGTGLGLSIVYGIIRRHGGDVRLQTHAGRGTVFSVFLPVATGEPAATHGKSIAC